MGIKHENADTGAEADQFRECIGSYTTHITEDRHDEATNQTVIEYVNGEGDAPFVKYRLTLEPVGVYSEEEYKALKATVQAAE